MRRKTAGAFLVDRIQSLDKIRFLVGKRREWRGVSKYYVRGDVVG